MWDCKSFKKITEILRCAGKESWPRLCKELNIRSGMPQNIVAGAIYGSKATAEAYQFEPHPWYDETRNVVVVENPWSIVSSVLMKMDGYLDYPVLGTHIELDAEVAIKILVFGEVP